MAANLESGKQNLIEVRVEDMTGEAVYILL